MSNKTTHVVMNFRVGTLTRAVAFRDNLMELGLKAGMSYATDSWIVTTDTRALQHADVLLHFLYGEEKGK